MNTTNLAEVHSIHFLGIGGIGMSALARMMLGRQWQKKVSGSDLSPSEITDELKKLGAVVFEGNAAGNVTEGIDLLVYTAAVLEDNPELLEAKRRGIPTMTYPQMLGLLSRDYYTIAISGTHGKTTTTGMVATLLLETGKEPTVVIGSLLQNSVTKNKSNFIAGQGKYFVAEACEYKRSFLELEPTILAITNIDNDHLDYYHDIADIQSAFHELALKVPEEGFVVANAKDPLLKPVLEGVKAEVVDYTKYVQMPPLPLKVIGLHNQLNAAVALTIADILKIPKSDAVAALQTFPGTWRRFEYKGKTASGALVYDDYGHHPTEIKVTLKAARELFSNKKIIVAFQPHLYSRTKLLLDDFAESFTDADEVLLAPIYAAREPRDNTVSSDILAALIGKRGKPAQGFPDFDSIIQYLLGNLEKDDVFITMGAGDIFQVGEKLLSR
ncbi:MAG TPA: UDP-N-acetylmuramate--L-alanine ligase [Candidatus Paceibacterota bacterium]